MRYIGPFFRMNSLCEEDIKGQLFFLSREAVKTIVLTSKCGILSSFRASKKSSSHTNNISILSNFSPLICLYRKSSPVFVHSKNSKSFDESSFKKDIIPNTNALMTMTLLELADYYSNYKKNDRNIESLEDSYSYLAKEQLEFYYENLRNTEGVFVEKKNISDSNSKDYKLINRDKKFNFTDQAFMMDAYYMYSYYHKEDKSSEDYKNFSLEILQMFIDFKEALYNVSLEEGCKILLSLNVFYEFSKDDNCKLLIMDLSDFLINKFEEKDYYIESLEVCSLLSLTLLDSYKHTSLIAFKDKSNEIFEKLESLYDNDKGIFIKFADKKEVKYSSLEICFYFLAILLHSKDVDSTMDYRNMISSLYKKLFITSNIIYSWPESPTLDETERYRGLSLKSSDMLDESYFRMPNLPTPSSTGIAPVFAKNITYLRKKDIFTRNKDSFDTNKNMLIFFMLTYYFKESVIDKMNFNCKSNELRTDESSLTPTNNSFQEKDSSKQENETTNVDENIDNKKSDSDKKA